MRIGTTAQFVGGAKLPLPYDREVEWLSSNGSGAFINTGCPIYDSTKVTVVLDNQNSTTNASYLFGAGGRSQRFYFREYQGNASWGTGAWWDNTSIGIIGKKTIILTNDGISVDGATSSRSGDAKTGLESVHIFKAYENLSIAGVKCYSIKVETDSAIVFAGIPVVKSVNGVETGFMYDRISGQLFGNAASSGAFTWGELSA